MYFAGETQIVSRQFLAKQLLIVLSFIVLSRVPQPSRLVEEEAKYAV
jgi:hypothetical protein